MLYKTLIYGTQLLLDLLPTSITKTFITSPDTYNQMELNAFGGETHREFKAVLMFYSEAFLKGAYFGRLSLEGESVLAISTKIYQAIELLELECGSSDDGLKRFGRQLHAGTEVIMKNIILANHDQISPSLINSALNLQNELIKSIQKYDGIILPSGWLKHAVYQIIKPSPTHPEHFNLVIANTGLGINHHYTSDDPDNIYPHLYRVWIEFKNIPREKIFDSRSAWYICQLALIYNEKFARRLGPIFKETDPIECSEKSIESLSEELGQYFYDNILGKFKEYLDRPRGDEVNNKLSPEQKSGSCAMSSLMAALMYYSESVERYHWYRLRIGHNLVEKLLKTLENIDKIDKNADFINNLTDGFYSSGLKLFKDLGRAMAFQQLQYLEARFPDEFKCAGLIGSGRSIWLKDKKISAIEKLSFDRRVVEELNKTVKLASMINEVISGLQLRYETTHLTIPDREQLKTKILQLEKDQITDEAEKLHISTFFETDELETIKYGKPEKLEPLPSSISDFQELLNIFKEYYEKADYHKDIYYDRFLDIFHRLHSGKGWSIIHEHDDANQIIELQKMCKKVVMRFVDLSNDKCYDIVERKLVSKYTKSVFQIENRRKITMDEIALLGQFQFLSWNLFKTCHGLMYPNSNVDWTKILPPQTIQHYLFLDHGNSNFFGTYENIPLKSFNETKHIHLYEIFLSESKTELMEFKPTLNFFPDSSLLSPAYFENIMQNNNLKAIFDAFFEDSELTRMISAHIKAKPMWELIPEDVAKILIFLCSNEKILLHKCPHFFILQHTLMSLLAAVTSSGGIYEDENFIFKKLNNISHENYDITLKIEKWTSGYPYHRSLLDSNIGMKITDRNEQGHELFYYLNRSRALRTVSNQTDLDAVLNYLKGARTAKIFDEPLFQYYLNHLLNMPKYRLSKDLNKNIATKKVYLFDKVLARRIIRDLSRLMQKSLWKLIDESENLTKTSREEIIYRVVNISVILTRFTYLMEHEISLEIGKILACLYNIIEPFSHLNSSSLQLGECEVSRLHFALSHICYSTINDEDLFMKHVKLGFDCSEVKSNRRTLAKFHWFMAKTNYVLDSRENVADDQFKYGIKYSPIIEEEILFLERLIAEKFLKYFLLDDAENYTLIFDENGYMVNIKSESEPRKEIILINLATGSIVKNGIVMISKSQFINSDSFQNFFPAIDHKYLITFGTAGLLKGIPIFFLPTLKGSDFLMINYNENHWLLRKWKDSWYMWRPENYLNEYYKVLNYRWSKNRINGFKRYNSNSNQVEVLLFDEGASEPILQIRKIINVGEVFFDVSVPGVADDRHYIISKKEDNDSALHVENFSKEGIIFAKEDSGEESCTIVIFNNYRLQNDSKPLTLIETKHNSGKTTFRVGNIPNMTISEDQRIGKDGYSMPGVLVAENQSQKILLLPLISRKINDVKSTSTYESVLIIPMVENYPCPQTRLERLVLAYFMMMAQNFENARKLLHPSTSFQQNEILNEKEIECMIQILEAELESPQSHALKLMVIANYQINKSKFFFQYKAVYKFGVNPIDNQNFISYFDNYMGVIRELPDKFNFFKMYPETLDDLSTLSKSLFKWDHQNAGTYYVTKECSKTPSESEKINETRCIFSNSYILNVAGISLRNISKTTNRRNIKLTIEKDLGQSETNEFDVYHHEATIVSDEKRRLFLNFREKLLKNIKSSCTNFDYKRFFGLGSPSIRSSRVLRSLFKAIRDFNTENGDERLIDFALHENRNGILDDLKKLDEYINEKIIELESKQKSLIETLALETYPIGDNLPINNVLESIMRLMHQRKNKTFSNLYSCFCRNSLYCIQKKFPQLNHDQCVKVREDSSVFFGQKILLDYMKMLKKSSDIFLTSSNIEENVSVDDLIIFSDELNKISKFNERLRSPIVMNFEFRSQKYRLTSEQASDVELFKTETLNNYKSIVIQRMMAAGKTLVLGTISVISKALKKDCLSILVPPSSLYQSNVTAIQNRTYHYFKKKGITFSFPRIPVPNNNEDISKTIKFLDNFLAMIRQTMTNRNYLILSPDHLQSFLNSYIEMISIFEGYDETSFLDILNRFANIYQIFREKASIIMDEIDLTMDPKKELNFPKSETERYNMIAVALLADIIEFMVFDSKIRESGLNIHTNNQASLTHENYLSCKQILIEYIAHELEVDDSLWRKFVPHEYAAKVLNFLAVERLNEEKYWILGLYESGNSLLADAIIIVRTQLNNYFEKYLQGTVNQNYGRAGNARPQVKYAVPYAAANTPTERSVFADRWETLLKTLLMASASPCSTATVKDVIKYVRKSIYLEASRTSETIDTSVSSTYKHLKMILPTTKEPVVLDENDFSHIESMLRGLRDRSRPAIRILFGYYIDEVFAEMGFPTEQISSNALHMASMFGSVQGYSGTIDNVNILPQRVINLAHKDHEDNEKYNGGIALKLIKDFDNSIIREISEECFTKSPLEMVLTFMNQIVADGQVPVEKLSAVIDAGAFFKNFKNAQVAEAFLKYFCGRIKVALYYDETSNKLEFLHGTFDGSILVQLTNGYLDTTDADDILKATQCEINQRFTFYDQRHITGSDITQPKFAHAILTAGPRILLRDILQGTLRMRQFMSSQKVHFIITESVRNFYNNKVGENKNRLRVSDLITLGALNEDEKQTYENEQLAFAKIDAEIRTFVLDKISKKILQTDTSNSSSASKEVLALFNSIRQICIRTVKENPKTFLLEQISDDPVKVLEEHTNIRLLAIDNVMQSPDERKELESLRAKLRLLYAPERKDEYDSLLKYLNGKKLRKFSNEQEAGTEVLMQTETQVLSLVEMNLESVFDGSILETGYANLIAPESVRKDELLKMCVDNAERSSVDVDNVLYTSLADIYNHQTGDQGKMTENILLTDGHGIGVTKDLVDFKCDSFENKYPIITKFSLEGTHLLIYSSHLRHNEHKIWLISAAHASLVYDEIKNEGSTNYIGHYFWLCDLFGEVITSNVENSAESIYDEPALKDAVEKLIFDLLVFNGSLPQILSNSYLKAIYDAQWLNNEHFVNRAKFLGTRMRVLAKKDEIIFEADDIEYLRLKNYSLGNRDVNTKNTSHHSQGYPKNALSNQDFPKRYIDNLSSNRGEFVNQNLKKEAEKLIEVKPRPESGYFFKKLLQWFQ